MADPKPTSERLEALKARWESDKGSRVFLQLADEYRRLGREEDAVTILNQGLEANPGHVGGRVARGRGLLAMGRAKEAAADLERVIESDPTQMVAYRLLVESYIQLRDADQARQRLRVYGLLNDSDPEIEELEKKIRELERTERTGAWPAPQQADRAARGEPGVPAEAHEPGEPGKAGEPQAAEPAASPAASTESVFEEVGPAGAGEATGIADLAEDAPLGDLSAPSEPAPFDTATPVEPPARAAQAVDPFPSLTLPEDRGRYLEPMDDELFSVPSPGRPEVAGDAEAGGPEEEIAASAPAAEPWDLSTEEPEAKPWSGAATEMPTAPGAEAADLDDPFDLGAPPAAAVPDLGALAEDDGGSVAERAETFTTGPPVEPPAEGRATVTLGRLYLRQGHLREAEESFREVLEREPDNAEAREGLDEIAALESPGIHGEELLEGFDPAQYGEGLTAKKRYALERYLERLRGGGGDVH